MMMLGTYVRRYRRVLRALAARPALRTPLELTGLFVLGFCLSAASLGNRIQPFSLAVLCVGLGGWNPLAFTLGSSLGYWLHWGYYGLQGLVWIAAGMPVCVMLSQKKVSKEIPMLLPLMAAMIVAAGGVIFQLWRGDDTPIAMYLLRIGLAFGSTWIISQVRQRRDATADWVAVGILVLSLAQLAPRPMWNLGFLAAGVVAVTMPLPAVALAGLALDLAQVSPVPMTAVLCLAGLLRLVMILPKRWRPMAMASVYLVVMGLCGQVDLYPLPPLLVGGLLGGLLPQQAQPTHRRGETGFAQVRLEMVASVLEQSRQMLVDAVEYPIDEAALMVKAADRACGTCPCRKGCREAEGAKQLPESLLHRPLINLDDVPVACKKRGRLMLELRRSQDQYRILKADRDRQQEYRGAVVQQYGFLSEYLQDLSDQLPKRDSQVRQHFQPELAVCSAGKEAANGDRCMWFAGTAGRYYLLLCDGMGTGVGAAEEARAAGNMLRRLLAAGYPASYALQSFNSLCTLRGRAGAVTVDLAEVCLESGKVNLYKWGAAPSWLLMDGRAEQIGQPGPPPGISVNEGRETVDRFSLRRGETLILLSDGIDSQLIAQKGASWTRESPSILASRILEQGCASGSDDATAAVLRLTPMPAAE